jgi:hypothetical protein
MSKHRAVARQAPEIALREQTIRTEMTERANQNVLATHQNKTAVEHPYGLPQHATTVADILDDSPSERTAVRIADTIQVAQHLIAAALSAMDDSIIPFHVRRLPSGPVPDDIEVPVRRPVSCRAPDPPSAHTATSRITPAPAAITAPWLILDLEEELPFNDKPSATERTLRDGLVWDDAAPLSDLAVQRTLTGPDWQPTLHQGHALPLPLSLPDREQHANDRQSKGPPAATSTDKSDTVASSGRTSAEYRNRVRDLSKGDVVSHSTQRPLPLLGHWPRGLRAATAADPVLRWPTPGSRAAPGRGERQATLAPAVRHLNADRDLQRARSPSSVADFRPRELSRETTKFVTQAASIHANQGLIEMAAASIREAETKLPRRSAAPLAPAPLHRPSSTPMRAQSGRVPVDDKNGLERK